MLHAEKPGGTTGRKGHVILYRLIEILSGKILVEAELLFQSNPLSESRCSKLTPST